MWSRAEIAESLRLLANSKTFLDSINRIQPGTFKRLHTDPDYSARIAYTKALREYVYNPAMLNTIFCDDALKEMFFRTFGYQGSLTFTMYPAVWMRDLPLLQLGHKSYFGDGILFGTNQISSDQKHIKVGKIEVGEYTIFDQQCSIGLNTFISDNCQFGFRNSIGLRCQIGRDVRVREMSSIGNCVKIGDGAQLGQNCIIHDFTVIEPGTKIDDGMRIPKFSIVSNDGIKPRRLASTKLILQ